MSGLSQRDAQQLVDNIRASNVAAHAIAARVNGDSGVVMGAFVGGLESVLWHFLVTQGRRDAAEALRAAMNDNPTADELAARNAVISSYRAKQPGPTA